MSSKKNILLILLLCAGLISDAQQLPFNTQFVANEMLYNPAVVGTKRTYDIRITYRDQWLGFQGAPVTESLSMNYAVLKQFGIGAYIYQDATGFTKRNNYSLCPAVKFPFADMTLSFGMAVSLMNYSVDGSQITTNQTLDPAIDRSITASASAPDMSAGVYLFNDKWKLGVSAVNLIGNTENFYKEYGFPDDTSHAGALQLFTHLYIYLGYVYGGNESIAWQNSLLVNYTQGAPIFLAYDLKCYIQKNFIVGASLRLNDAIALEAGIISHDMLQICYSYDYITSQIGRYTSGTQEITLIFSMDKAGGRGRGGNGNNGSDNGSFSRRHYRNMF